MISHPFHSPNPPGGTMTASSAAARATAVPTLAIGLVMSSLILMNTTVQHCIHISMIVYADPYAKNVPFIN